jgi:hypothetical protein
LITTISAVIPGSSYQEIIFRNEDLSWEWWCTPIIQTLKRQRHENHEFEDSLGWKGNALKQKKGNSSGVPLTGGCWYGGSCKWAC